MQDYLKKDFEKILKSSSLVLHRWMKESDSNTGRVYDKNLEELPLTVDFYSGYVRVVDYSDNGLSDEDIDDVFDIISRFLYTEKDKIIYKYRKKREGREQEEKGNESLLVSVKENGLSFECDLSLYADTGLFLEGEKVRETVCDISSNEKVLNLFSYTSSFSVYAAKGGAEEVVSVDKSNVYTSWARRNLNNNGFLDEKKYRCVKEDVRDYLKKAKERGERYDLIIIDPPSFSNSHRTEDFDVQEDYLELLLLSREILLDDGVIIFSENRKNFHFEKDKVERYFSFEEITSGVCAVNFTSKNRAQRVWVMKKDDNSSKRYEKDSRSRSEHPYSKTRRNNRDEYNKDQKHYRSDNLKDESRHSDATSYRDKKDDRARHYNDDFRYDKKSKDSYNDKKAYYKDKDSNYDNHKSNHDGVSRRNDNHSYSHSYRNDDESREYKEGRHNGNSFKDNATSHMYKKEYNGERKGERRSDTRQKKSGPKPFGYDSFSPSKKRDGANISWIKNQIEIDEDE